MKSTLTAAAMSGMVAALALAQSVPHYSVIDLGTLGGTFSAAYGINLAGEVAGSATLSPTGQNQHAFLWYQGHFTDLGTLGGPNSEASGPNNRGDAAILSETAAPDPLGEDVCGLGTHLTCVAGVWKNEYFFRSMTLLPTLGGNNAQALAINDVGEIAGFAETKVKDSSCATPSQVVQFEAVKWDPNGTIHELPPLKGDTVGFAFWMNNNGEVVGGSGLCSNTTIPEAPSSPHAVLWEKDGTPTDLGNLGGGMATASSLNDLGDVVGAADSPEDGNLHTFLWTKVKGMQDLGTLPGDFLSVAPTGNAINNHDEVVGFSCPGPNGNCRAFVWMNNVMMDMNNLVSPGEPLYLLNADGVNDAGEIAGEAMAADGTMHAFLAIPSQD